LEREGTSETMEGAEFSIDARGLRFACCTFGRSDGVPVIALHGWMDNAASFSKLTPHLTDLRIFTLDLAGHGHSAHRPEGWSYDDLSYAADVIAVADALLVERFFLLGHSMGGGIATLVAGAIPRRVLGVLCIEALGPPSTDESGTALLLSRAVRQQRKQSGRTPAIFPTFEAAIGSRMAGAIPIGEEAARTLAVRELVRCGGGFAWRRDPAVGLPPVARLTEGQVLSFLERTRCSIHVVLAEQGLLRAHPVIERRAALYGNVQIFREAGSHYFHLEGGEERVADRMRRLVLGELASA
jgi:pimeloyl-ACP methyl ester carboxylesterase